MEKNTIIGLIPARSGSKRCPGKNTRTFMGHPLIAWTIMAAKDSGIFTEIIVSTDSLVIKDIAASYGAGVIMRPAEISQDASTDYQWVKHAREMLNFREDCFGIMRPTNPLKTAATLRDCWDKFRSDHVASSLRTVRPSAEHPFKQWFDFEDSGYILPFNGIWFTDQPTQSLRQSYVQDGVFYINMMTNLDAAGGQLTIYPVMPYVTSYPEHIDINTEDDFERAHLEAYIRLTKPVMVSDPLSGKVH